MNRITHFVAYVVLLSLSTLTWAADEDVAVSVYLSFDPVTGQLTEQVNKPVHNPDLSSTGVTDSQSESPGVVEPQSVAAISAQDPASNIAEQRIENGPGTSVLMAGAVGVTVLILVVGLFLRKNQQKLSS